jgi:hypothetical protein
VVLDEISSDFYKRNTNVVNLTWQNGHIAIVHLKDKGKEKYDMNDSKQKKAFIDKYGEWPLPPLPPLPPPPPPPTPPVSPKV